MNIRTALDNLATIQLTVSITSPITATIARAYKYFPPPEADLDVPCFANNWSLPTPEQRRPGGLRIQDYVIRSQLFVRDEDLERAADIATAFWVAYIDALDSNIDLDGAVSIQRPRTADPAHGPAENRPGYYVLDSFLDVEMKDTKTFST